MLFSDKQTADFINANFEPAWQSVRDVPTITIDLGGGQRFTRTLHGNIATYICTADGYVVDILPGIYQPQEYRDSLTAVKRVAEATAATTMSSDLSKLISYHRDAAKKLKPHAKAGEVVAVKLKADQAMDLDTHQAETVGRFLIHKKLAASAMVKPADMQRWVYKTVLRTDLDDPYLGLGETLFGTYPFRDDNRPL